MKEFNTVLVNFLGFYDLNGVPRYTKHGYCKQLGEVQAKDLVKFSNIFFQSPDTNTNRIAWLAEQKNPVKSHNF